MTTPPEGLAFTVEVVVVPALAVADGHLDAYMRRAADTWVDRWLVAGTTARGDELGVAGRARLLDRWLAHVEPARLLACAWEPVDVVEALARGVAPIVLLRGLDTLDEARCFLAGLPAGCYLYSHPTHTRQGFNAELARWARREGLPLAGAKVAKVNTDQLGALRSAVGPACALWDARSRHIAASVKAGASGVVATPLSPVPWPFPARALDVLQPAVDAVQAELDGLPDRAARTRWLHRQAITVR